MAERDRLGDDGAGDRGTHRRIREALGVQVTRPLVAELRRLRIGIRRLRGFELRLRNDAILEQLLLTRELCLGHFEVRAGGGKVRFRLLELRVQVGGVDLHNQVAGLDEGADFDRHLRDLARGRLRLDLDDVDWLNDAGRLGVHDNVATLNGRRGDRRNLGLGLGTGREGDEGEHQERAVHGGLRL